MPSTAPLTDCSSFSAKNKTHRHFLKVALWEGKQCFSTVCGLQALRTHRRAGLWRHLSGKHLMDVSHNSRLMAGFHLCSSQSPYQWSTSWPRYHTAKIPFVPFLKPPFLGKWNGAGKKILNNTFCHLPFACPQARTQRWQGICMHGKPSSKTIKILPTGVWRLAAWLFGRQVCLILQYF